MFKLKENKTSDEKIASKEECLEAAIELSQKELFFNAYSLLRSRFDKSELTDSEIKSVLRGDVSVFWLDKDSFELLDKPNRYVTYVMKEIKDKYEKIIVLKGKNYSILEQKNKMMFEMVSPKVFKEDVFYSVSQIKNFMYDAKGEYFCLNKENVCFYTEIDVPKFNIF